MNNVNGITRINDAFKQGKTLITYIMAGDPNLNATKDYVIGLAKSGVDIVELGIPFSDPSADGGAILAAGERALSNNYTTDDYFALVQEIRKSCAVPIVFMSYANILYSYGIDEFFSRMKEAGVDGIILPDVPVEECQEFCVSATRAGVAYIPLAAPTSQSRVKWIAEIATGFLYCVSSCGVTGERKGLTVEDSIYKDVTVNKAVGFGISSAQDAVAVAKNFDGVIIGSKIVRYIANGEIDQMYSFVKEVKKAIQNS